ncbi:MAG: Mrr restriction system protein [Alistipes senegalensis]|nr:Mrr restriction system protein [Alistipes senegalensis]
MNETKATRQAEIVFAAMKAIEASGGEMRISDIYETLSQSFPLTDHEKEQTKSGVIRWKAYLNFYSIEVSKVGYLIKKSGIWHLTKEGAKALAAGAGGFFTDFHGKYSEIQKAHEVSVIEENAEQPDDLDMLQGQASKGIREYIIKKNPYEFQDLAAALLRAMGYYTPFIAPKGKDGGVDIIAYQDPLGTTSPQLKVQVKHYPTTAIPVDVVRSLGGVLFKDGEVGLLITSGTFTSESKKEARNYHRRLRLIDIDEFVELWIKFYDKMSEEDKSLLPIIPVYFLKS